MKSSASTDLPICAVKNPKGGMTETPEAKTKEDAKSKAASTTQKSDEKPPDKKASKK